MDRKIRKLDLSMQMDYAAGKAERATGKSSDAVCTLIDRKKYIPAPIGINFYNEMSEIAVI